MAKRKRADHPSSLKKQRVPSIAYEVKEEDIPARAKCEFCHHGKVEDILLRAGKFYRYGEKYFHYFCVLFSRDGEQKGEDDEGLNGFLMPQIEKELKRGKNLKCIFCGKNNATVHCCHKICRRAQTQSCHFPCGRQNNQRFVFNRSMDSFCWKHLPKQSKKLTNKRITDWTCSGGCLETVKKTKDKYMVSPCCGRPLHTDCLQAMALSYGMEHFRCPMCKNKEQFTMECIWQGIYVPQQDASWEMQENEQFYGFQRQGQLRRRCDARQCLCNKGRRHDQPNSDFRIVRCQLCGAKSIHVKCGGLSVTGPEYKCPDHDMEAPPPGGVSRSSGSSEESDDEPVVINTLPPPIRPHIMRKTIECRDLVSSSDESSSDDDEDSSAFKRKQRLFFNQLRTILNLDGDDKSPSNSGNEDDLQVVHIDVKKRNPMVMINQYGQITEVKAGPPEPRCRTLTSQTENAEAKKLKELLTRSTERPAMEQSSPPQQKILISDFISKAVERASTSTTSSSIDWRQAPFQKWSGLPPSSTSAVNPRQDQQVTRASIECVDIASDDSDVEEILS